MKRRPKTGETILNERERMVKINHRIALTFGNFGGASFASGSSADGVFGAEVALGATAFPLGRRRPTSFLPLSTFRIRHITYIELVKISRNEVFKSMLTGLRGP